MGGITSNGNQLKLSDSTSTDLVSTGFRYAYASGSGTVTFAEVSSNGNIVIFNDSVGTTVNGGVSSVTPAAGVNDTNEGTSHYCGGGTLSQMRFVPTDTGQVRYAF